MSKFRILHLRATNFYGGPERQLHLHARSCLGTEFEITIGSFSEGGSRPRLLDIAADDRISTHLFEVTSAYDPGAIGRLRAFLKQSRIDILCTHDYRTNIIGWRAVKGTGARWVAFSRGWTSENLKIHLYQMVDKFVLRFADRIVAVSGAQKKKLTRLFIAGGRISVVHNAVVPQEFDPIGPIDLRHRFRLPDDAIVCVAGGRFSKEKGQKYLVQAAAECIRHDQRLRFIMFGDGPSLGDIRRLVSRLNVGDSAVCPGFEKNFIGCLKGADILVNPSLSEGLPNIVLEAMAMKIPVVATAVGGVPELVENDRGGLLVPPADVHSLANAINLLAGDEKLRARFAENGLDRVTKSFSFAKQAQELGNIYREVLSTKANAHD